MSHLVLYTREDVAEVIQGYNDAGVPTVLDIETTGLDRFTDKIISVQLCIAGEDDAVYFAAEFADELAHLSAPLVLHNFKFDFAFLQHCAGVDLRDKKVEVPEQRGTGHRELRDTMLMHHLLDENAEHSLDAIVKERWNDPYKEIFWAAYPSFEAAPEEARVEYACKDVVYTGKLYCELLSALEVSGVPEALVAHVHRLALSLYDSELSGVRVDLDYLSSVGADLQAKIASAHTRMMALAPHEIAAVEDQLWLEKIEKYKSPKGKAGVKRPEFNWDSGDQLKRLVYGELGLPEQTKWDAKNKVRKATLDDAAMEELEHAHPLIEEIRAHRANQKVFGSFIEGTLQRQRGGRIFPSFSVNGTVTGRISSSNPNLQQLPSGGGVRGIYCAEAENLLLSRDYGMLEVVVAAHFSQDPALLRIIHDGASKHDITAEGLGIPRGTAKTLNFALGYGATKFKVKTILNCSMVEAEHALNKYWEVYAGERRVIDECQKRVDDGLPIINLYGRRRRFPTSFPSEQARAKAHRQAYNALIQGTGADIVHQAFYTFADYMKRTGYGRAVLEIHDEILGEARADVADEALEELGRIMVEAGQLAGLNVPLTTSPSGPMFRWED